MCKARATDLPDASGRSAGDLRGIAASLDTTGVLPRGGVRWHPESVRNILSAIA